MILDTNAIFDFADANQRLLDRIQQADDDLHLPVIVLGEYRYGLKSSRLRVARESWLDELESTAIVLTITSETSRIYADIRYALRHCWPTDSRDTTSVHRAGVARSDSRCSVTIRILIKSLDFVRSMVTEILSMAFGEHVHAMRSTRNEISVCCRMPRRWGCGDPPRKSASQGRRRSSWSRYGDLPGGDRAAKLRGDH